jgi:hypothetical protein
MRFDKRKPVLTPEQVESLPEFAPLNAQQKTFILLLSADVPVAVAVDGAYECKNSRSAKSFAYDLMRRRTLQPVLTRLYEPKDDDKAAEFMERLEKLLRRGNKVTQPEVDALVLYGKMNHLLPPDYSPLKEIEND